MDTQINPNAPGEGQMPDNRDVAGGISPVPQAVKNEPLQNGGTNIETQNAENITNVENLNQQFFNVTKGAEEYTVKNLERIIVTNKRLIVDRKTFVVSNISSVEARKTSNRFLRFLMVIFILAAPFGWNFAPKWKDSTVVIALVVFALVFWYLYKRSKTYSLVVTTNASESEAVASKNREYIESLRNAVNVAITE